MRAVGVWGRLAGREGTKVERAVILRVAVGDRAFKCGRSRAVGTGVRRRRDVEVLLVGEWRCQRQGTDNTLRRHGKLFCAVVEGGTSVGQISRGQLVINAEVGRVELGERLSTPRLNPAHARPELPKGVDRNVHQGEGAVVFLPIRGQLNGHETSGNLLHRANRKAAEVSSADLGEETLHEERHSVEVGDDKQGICRTLVLLKKSDGHPEEPGTKRLQTLILLRDGEGGADFARSLEEAAQSLNQSRVLLVVLQMGLDLLNLLERLLIGLQILLAGLAGTMLGSRRRRRSWKSAALGDEVGKLGEVLPAIHGFNHS